jgi:subtilisin family serine protease
MKLFFNSLLLLLFVSSASAKLREKKEIFSDAEATSAGAAAQQGQAERPKKFGVTHCASKNERVDNEYILDVAKDVKIRSVMDIFEVNFPNGKITHKYKRAFHGFAVSGVTEDEIQLFADGCDNMVVEIQENAKAHKSIEWGLDRIDDRAGLDSTFLPSSPGLNGTGVTIYIIDTGVKTSHNEFRGRITQGKDFTGEGQFDGDGHGTHVAGAFLCPHLREREIEGKLKSQS